MRSLLRVLATGFFALLPVLLIYLLVGQLFDMMIALTTPLVDLLPQRAWLFEASLQVRAAVFMVALIFLVGVAARTNPGRRLGDWVEERALSRLPLYPMLRSLSSRLSGNENLTSFRPALVTTWPHMKSFAFVVEEHASGDFTVFMPIAPTPSVGFVQVVGKDHVQLLDVPASRALSAVLSWGDGAESVLVSARARTPDESGDGRQPR